MVKRLYPMGDEWPLEPAFIAAREAEPEAAGPPAFGSELSPSARACGPPAFGSSLEDATRRALVQWLDLVAGWNARTDLTAARSQEELVELMLVDALVLAARIAP